MVALWCASELPACGPVADGEMGIVPALQEECPTGMELAEVASHFTAATGQSFDGFHVRHWAMAGGPGR
eukprot:2015618-Lingulodinium_polyedra.AAC.1